MGKIEVTMAVMRERLSPPSRAASRPPPFFVGDDLALDFLNTRAAPAGETIEWLGSGLDLVQWLEAARAVPPSVAAASRKEAGARDLDAVAAEARDFREWFRRFVEAHAG